jgi:PLP dependent protein
VVGLMAVGASGPPEAARPGFRLLASLADRLGLAERSMGMSSDLEVAVQEGATIVRVGSALFGARPRP